jgi:LmbE family N-acetylglucosaminyl deacetylase
MSVLVVAAHPDDEVLGAGGTIAALAQAGEEVTIAILGEGITSRHGKRDEADQGELEELGRAAGRAAEILGAREPRLYGLPDQRFETLPLLKITHLVEQLVDEVRPDAVYTHHGGDLNLDHVVVHRAVLTATRPGAGVRVPAVLAFETPSSTDWGFGQLGTFEPTVFRDVSATLELKIRAMQEYASETRPYPHPRSSQALEALARYRGSTAGFDAAEAFSLVRQVVPSPRAS